MGLENEPWWTVAMPTNVLCDQRLPPPCRALYLIMLSRCPAGSLQCVTSRHNLMALSGLGSRATLRGYLSRLEQAGWTVSVPNRGTVPSRFDLDTAVFRASEETVEVPGIVTEMSSLSLGARWLYVFLLMKCNARRADRYRTTQAKLTAEAGWRSRLTTRAAIDQLVQAGWLWLDTGRGSHSHVYKPLDPHLAQRKLQLRRAQARLRRETFRGEGFLKEILNLIVAGAVFQDNARPNFLVNPLTGERLEFDRWYPEHGVAVEFNGSQHYTPSDKFSAEEVNKQIARDLMKQSLARMHNIKLIVVRPHELSLATLSEKLHGILPLRTVREQDPVARYLQTRVRRYVENTIAASSSH